MFKVDTDAVIGVLLLGVTLLPPSPAAAKFLSKERTGIRGPAVLNMGAGVRAMALGEAYVGIADDASAAYWNPAGLNQLDRSEGLLMHGEVFLDQTHDVAAFAKPVWRSGERETWAVHLSRLDMPSFDVVDQGGATSNAHPQETVAGLSYARVFDSVSVGLTGKFVHQREYQQQGQAYALDSGVFYSRNRWSWGAQAANLGSRLRIGNTDTDLPLVIRMGGGYRLPFPASHPRHPRWLLTGQLDLPMDEALRSHLGLEYKTDLTEDWRVAARCGFQTRAGGLWSLGAGVERGALSLNYAFSQTDIVGAENRLDVGYRFGHPLIPETRRRALMEEAQNLMDDGQGPAAGKVISEILELSPHYRPARRMDREIRLALAESLDPKMLLERADEELGAKKFESATNLYRKILLVQPGHPEALERLAKAEKAWEAARLEAARMEVARGLEIERREKIKNAQRVTSQGRFELALPMWSRVLALSPQSGEGREGMARCREGLYVLAVDAEKTGHEERARELLNRIKETGAPIKDSLERLSRLENRWRDLKREQAQASYAEGLKAFQSGDWKSAVGLFRKALELNPGDKTLLRALERAQAEWDRHQTPTP